MNRLRLFFRQTRLDWLVLLGFILLACGYWWPLPLELSTAQLEWPVIDPAFAQWIIGWGDRAITHYPWRFFEAPMFYPYQHVFAWGDNMFSITLFAIPLIRLVGLMRAYNILLIGTSAASAFTLYLFLKYVLEQRAAAVIGGLIWGFTHYRYIEYAHIQILALQWLPLVFLFAEKIRRQYRRRLIAWLALSVFLSLATNIYLFFFTSLLFAVYLLGLLVSRSLEFVAFKRMAAGWVIGGLASIPVYLPSYITNRNEPTIRAVWDQYSTNLAHYVPFPASGRLSRMLFDPLPDGPLLYPNGVGLLAAGLLFYGVWRLLKERRKWRENVLPWIFLAITFGSVLAALGPRIYWKEHLLVKYNPVFFATYLLVPGYKVLRTPSRWHYITVLALAVVAAWAIAPWLRRQKRWVKLAVVGAASLVVIIEQFPTPIVTTPTYRLADYPVYNWLQQQPDDATIVELPVFPIPWRRDTLENEARRIAMQTHHWKRRVGGAIMPYIPAKYQAESRILSEICADPQALEILRGWKVRYVLYLPHDFSIPAWNELTREQLEGRLASCPGLKPLHNFNGSIVYELVY